MRLRDVFWWKKRSAPSISLRAFGPDLHEMACQIADFPAIIGRGEHADLRLPNRHVSRTHCALSCQGREIVLRDLESRHGTWINGERIDEQPLHVDDEISLGTTRLLVVDLVTPQE